MRYLLTLAAAASLAACHQRSENEVGAAPERGDTTAVTATDTTKATVTDTTMGQTPAPTDTTAMPQDQGMTPDTTAAPSTPDTTGAYGHDTTGAAQPTDTTAQPTDTTAAPNQ